MDREGEVKGTKGVGEGDGRVGERDGRREGK